MKTTKNFAEFIEHKLSRDPAFAEAFEEEAFNADLAIKVYEARVAAGLTQKQLADKLNTQQSVISRIEDADYDGRSLQLLRRIASALKLRLRVEFYSVPRQLEEDEFSVIWNKKAKDGWHPKFNTNQTLAFVIQ